LDFSAGVSGLTTALLLSKAGNYDITVAAKHMPGDYDIEYASPWAGANVMPMSLKGSEASEYEKRSWVHLERLCRELPEAGIHFQGKLYPEQ
jgi:D-amino-acid oxidase